MNNFKHELTELLNKYSKENGSNTPDWVLVQYLIASLAAFDAAVKARDKWWNHTPKIGGSTGESDDPPLVPYHGIR